MAGKGGGSWKVAYADFVTAMMAFFLVMWIGAQDVKVRQSVANYFVDPSGVSKSPKSGGIMNDPSPGNVSKESSVQNSQGVRPASGQPPSPATAAVLSWLKETPTRHEHWRNQAARCREQAAQTKGNNSKHPDVVANEKLAQMLSTALAEGLPPNTPEVYKLIVLDSLKGVDWQQVADVILGS